MSVTLTRIDPDRNMARFYKIDVQPTLFGEWAVIREWGRIGQGGRVCVVAYATRGLADLAAVAWLGRKARRAYR